jgi:hypothetical protein
MTYESFDDSTFHGMLLGDHAMWIWVVLTTVWRNLSPPFSRQVSKPTGENGPFNISKARLGLGL